MFKSELLSPDYTEASEASEASEAAEAKAEATTNYLVWSVISL
jgi:hypothetical protein